MQRAAQNKTGTRIESKVRGEGFLPGQSGIHALFGDAGVRGANWLREPGAELEAMRRLVPVTVERVIGSQRMSGGEEDGAFETASGCVDGRFTAYEFVILASCWGDAVELGMDWDLVEARLGLALEFLMRRLSPMGWLDLGGRYSPNEAGFPLTGMVAVLEAMRRDGWGTGSGLAGLLEAFIVRAADGVLGGDAYSANHRWTAIAAPLAAVNTIHQDPRYLEKVEAYLADGIDCDEAGCWYEERSPNYNTVANEGIWELAVRLGRPELIEHVVRSGEFILRHIQPNGEADTSFSFRQDRGASGREPMNYLMARRLAHWTGDGRYTTLAAHLFPKQQIPGGMFPVLEELRRQPAAFPAPVPMDWEVGSAVSGRLPMWRLRRGRSAMTVIADPGMHFFTDVLDQWGGPRRSEDWLHLHHGDVVIQTVHLAAASQASVQPEVLQIEPSGDLVLAGKVAGSEHVQNFREGAPKVIIPWEFRHEIRLRPQNDGFWMEVDASNATAIYATLTMFVRFGVEIWEGGRRADCAEGGVVALRGGEPLKLIGESGVILVTGLPKAQTERLFFSKARIPEYYSESCIKLSVGLRFPISFSARFQLL